MLSRRHERRQRLHMQRLHHDAKPASPVLEGRDPALEIKLALPLLPTIDVTLFASKQPTPTPAPSPNQPPATPPPTVTSAPNVPSPGNGNGGGNGNGNGNGDSNNGGTNNGGSNNGGSNNGGSNNGGSNNGGSNNGGSNGGGSNNGGSSNGGSSDGGGGSTDSTPPPSTSAPASGNSANSPSIPSGADDTGSESSPSNGGQGHNGSNVGNGSIVPPNNLAGSSDFPNPVNDGGSTGGNSGTSSSNGLSGSDGGVPVVAGAASLPGPGVSNAGASSGSRSIVGSQSGGGTIAAPTSTDTKVDDVHGGGTEGAAASSGFPKGAAIAIGTILALLFLLGLLFLLRRHRRAQRNERMQRWWFSKKRTSQTYNDDKLVVQIPPPRSARSSFATNVDHSLDFEVNFNPELPAMPPMAEVRRSRNEIDYPASPTAGTPNGDQRYSLGSVNSSSDSHFLIVNHRPSLETNDFHNPNSNPFTPMSERFAFPRPPSDAASDISGTEETTGTYRTASMYRTPDTSPSPPEHQNLPAPGDPFADSMGALSTQTHTTDPFSDSTVSTSHATGAIDSILENPPVPAMRPFNSRQPDEVTLRVGERVRVLQIFDDGWALVDKLSEGVAVQRGLVPLACLR